MKTLALVLLFGCFAFVGSAWGLTYHAPYTHYTSTVLSGPVEWISGNGIGYIDSGNYQHSAESWFSRSYTVLFEADPGWQFTTVSVGAYGSGKGDGLYGFSAYARYSIQSGSGPTVSGLMPGWCSSQYYCECTFIVRDSTTVQGAASFTVGVTTYLSIGADYPTVYAAFEGNSYTGATFTVDPGVKEAVVPALPTSWGRIKTLYR